VRIFALITVFGAVLMCQAANPASAAGNVSVWQDGTTQQYGGVKIRIVDKTLRITSADGKGTLVIQKAACSYVGEIQTCLPYQLALEQGGTSKPVNIKRGTVYVNLTSGTLQLPNSTTQIGPRGIVMSMTTKIGTVINLTGTIDEVVK
jgi:hypothetical protein